jgi:hypothetical protein
MAKSMRSGTGGRRMAKKGTGKDAMSTNAPVSTTAPRAKGPAGKGGNWRAGVPHTGQVGRLFSTGGTNGTGRPATQGSSLANMGDGMTANGLNVPRGYFASNKSARGTAAGSTPLAHTGSKKGKYYPASRVTGPLF